MSRGWILALALPAMLALPARVAAQDISLDMLTPLAAKASDKVVVTLNGSLLQLAANFMDDKDPEEVKVKTLINGLKGIYVRSFKFSKAGDYTDADLRSVRSQLRGWSEVVTVDEGEGHTGVYLKLDGKKIQGLVVLTAEPKELTVINIVGSIDPDQLRELSGHFGIPELGGAVKKSPEKK
jgi:hypothetical protein